MYVPDPTPPRRMSAIVGALAERARRPKRTAAAERSAERTAQANATSAAIDALDSTAREAGTKARHRTRRTTGPTPTAAASTPTGQEARTPAPVAGAHLEDAYAERLYAKAWTDGGK